MSLQEIANKVFMGKDIKTQFIGIHEGSGKAIQPEYADEILETHGNQEVSAYRYLENINLLVVHFKEEN